MYNIKSGVMLACKKSDLHHTNSQIVADSFAFIGIYIQ